MSKHPAFVLENRTGYDTGDLLRFFQKGLRATGTHGKIPSDGRELGSRNGRSAQMNADLRIVVLASPIRSRGCAEVGHRTCSACKPGDDRETCCVLNNGSKMVIAIAAPWRYSLRRLARLLEHEAAHIRGFEHERMPRDLLLSLGPIPAWAKGTVLRYRGRAPAQLPLLRTATVPSG